MPQVYNKYHGNAPLDAVYIGRGSKWGNPFVIGPDGTREEVIQAYEEWFPTSGLYNDLSELTGKDVVCFCAPKACHGDFLVALANEDQGW